MDKVSTGDRYRATLRYLADARDTGTPSTARLIESLKATTQNRLDWHSEWLDRGNK